MSAVPASQYLVNQRLRNCEQSRDIPRLPAIGGKPEDGRGLKVGQLCDRVVLPLRSATPASILATGIFSARHPFEVLRPVIFPIPVDVVHRSIRKVRSSVKGLAHQAVNEHPRAIAASANCPISCLESFASNCPSDSHVTPAGVAKISDAAKIGDAVIGSAPNLSPNLIGKIIMFGQRVVSHDRTPIAVIGQGRALLTQRFRPVSYGRFMVRSQERMAS